MLAGASTRMPAFQPINAGRPTAEPHHVRAETEVPRRPALRNALLSRSPSPDSPELPTRDWTLGKIVGKRDENGVNLYGAQWESTMLDVQFIQTEGDTHYVRYQGRTWPIEVLTEPTLNDSTGVFEALVSWEDTWHHIWDLTSALESVIEWERANHPDRNDPLLRMRHWWQHPQSLVGYRGPEIHLDPTMRREFTGDDFFPELNGDYTFSFLEWILEKLANGELSKSTHSTIVELLNQPLRQRLMFGEAFVQSGQSYKLHRTEFIHATIVYVVGHARADHHACNTCIDPNTIVPFPNCVIFTNMFYGYVATVGATKRHANTCQLSSCCCSCVSLRRRNACDLHLKCKFRWLPQKYHHSHSAQCGITKMVAWNPARKMMMWQRMLSVQSPRRLCLMKIYVCAALSNQNPGPLIGLLPHHLQLSDTAIVPRPWP